VALTLERHGWSDVRPLTGGFDAWRAGGYPVESKAHEAQTPFEIAENLRLAEGDQDLPP
jgi:3-mercaptopyruvate sulfurtransferase SseA